MIFKPTFLKGSYEIELKPLKDDRGWFVRTFCKNEFKEIGHEKEWVQMNHSYTAQKGSLRGMHFQLPPHREIKLVRCVRGKVYDVIVDLRKNSATFLQWFGLELSADKMNMIYIPEGFAHGFQTLTDNCELVYCHSEFYVPNAESGLRYNDSVLKINWPLSVSNISERDNNHALLNENFRGI
jgi:dTDP-4-dehydrorhamnose 3,5-epimerase